MSDIGVRYAVPPEIDRFVDEGFLELSMEQPKVKTVEFHIPSSRTIDHRARATVYCLNWIHPDYNADFCHCYDETPGDLPNFSVEVRNSEGPTDSLDDLKTVDDLDAWLEDFRAVSSLV